MLTLSSIHLQAAIMEQQQQKQQEKEEERQSFADIRDLIRLNVYTAKFASGNLDKSVVHNVMMKIYDGKKKELKNYFQCSWCQSVMMCSTRDGTAPLSRHIKGCKEKPAGYVLPKMNLHLDRRLGREAEQNTTNGNERIAEILAKLMEIAILYGTISSEEFSSLLPADGDLW